MEKNEAFRKQVLSRLYGLPDPTATESAKEEDTSADKDIKLEDEKETSLTKDEEEEEKTKPVKDSTEDSSEPVKPEEGQGESEKDTVDSLVKKGDQEKEEEKDEAEVIVKDEDKDKDSGEVQKEKDKVAVMKTDHSNNNREDSGTDLTTTKANHNNSSSTAGSSSSKTITTPTTTTSHLYSVLMAPLDGRSPYRDHSLRCSSDRDADSGPRKRLRLDNSASDKTKPEQTPESGDHIEAKSNVSVGMDLTKNQKKRLKKKKRKNLLNKLEVQRAKDFIYSSENEQYSVEKLRTMIEDMTEFLDAIWDVYCSEARVKGENVEEDGYRAAAVLKCLSASGEGSWGDLQLLSRAKSVLVLRNKQLAASTIARVDNELGYDADIRSFIVRMLKFWMDEIVTKG